MRTRGSAHQHTLLVPSPHGRRALSFLPPAAPGPVPASRPGPSAPTGRGRAGNGRRARPPGRAAELLARADGACAAASGRGPAKSTPGVVVSPRLGPRKPGKAGAWPSFPLAIPAQRHRAGRQRGRFGNQTPLRGPSSTRPLHPTSIPQRR